MLLAALYGLHILFLTFSMPFTFSIPSPPSLVKNIRVVKCVPYNTFGELLTMASSMVIPKVALFLASAILIGPAAPSLGILLLEYFSHSIGDLSLA